MTGDINVTAHYESLKGRVLIIIGGGQWNVIGGIFKNLEELNTGVTSKAM